MRLFFNVCEVYYVYNIMHRIHAAHILNFVISSLFFLTPANIQAANFVTCQGKQLLVTSDKLEMLIEGGAVTRITDLATQTVMINQTDPYAGRPSGVWEFVGFVSKDSSSNVYTRRPSSSTAVTCTTPSATSGQLVYNLEGGSTLTLVAQIDTATGEISLSQTGIEGQSNLKPYTIDIPVLAATPAQIILGSGAAYSRTAAAKNDQSQVIAHGLNAPSVAVYEFSNLALAVFSESFQPVPDWINLYHTATNDRISLHTEQDKVRAGTQTIVSATWRFGTFANWTAFAKRWHAMAEAKTSVKPLWENPTPWVRNVHSMYSGINSYHGSNQSRYQELAAITPPQNTLYYLWNGDRIILFGDHTLGKGLGFERPDKTELPHITQYGWPLLIYHPYTLVWREDQMQARLTQFQNQGRLPQNYQFNPDYQGGNAANWYPFWQDVIGTYDDTLSVVHPAATKTQDYFVRNTANYLQTHGAKAGYFDTMGIDGSWFFSNQKQLIDGKSYLQGEVEMARKLQQAHPNIGIMSEFQANWLLPYQFFTWEGTDTHTYQKNFLPLVLNHPLRVALLGRYTWTREDSTDAGQDDEMAALLGTLPAYHMANDYPISASRLNWLQNRAKLFVAEKLFNDVPEVWDPEARAYYRSHLGYWFKFKRVNNVWSYVQEVPGQADIVRLNANGLINPGPTIPPSGTPSPTVTPTPVVVPGDTNGDGKVDGIDYSVWRMHYSQNVTGGPSQGDFDSNGKVDGIDYVLWKNNYGKW